MLCRNMKDYLSQCIDSVLKQKCKNMEIVLVNDLTKDPACEIMSNYYLQHQDIISMDVTDSDLLPGGARNRGLSLAKGDFITFVDGDDWLAFDAYDQMMPYFKDGEVDMVICDYNECFIDGNKTIHRKVALMQEGVYRPIDTEDMFKNESYSWNAIFRRSLLDKIGFYFFEKTIYDDLAIHIPFAKSRKIAYIPRPLYQHRKHPNEITTKANTDQHCRIIEVVELLANEFKEKVDMSIWGDKFNELLIVYLFYYIHYLMLRGSVVMNEETLRLCAQTFINCGGSLPKNIERYGLLELQLKSPAEALMKLKQIKERGEVAFVK